jgi:hypothetical protein
MTIRRLTCSRKQFSPAPFSDDDILGTIRGAHHRV